MRKIFLTVGVCLLAAVAAEASGFAVESGPMAASPAPMAYAGEQPTEDQSYEAGTKAMNEARWADAETAFKRAAEMRGKRADGAIYWQAYAQNKEGRQRQAVRTCGVLASEYAQSKWRSECDALLVDVRRVGSVSVREDGEDKGNPDDEIKMLALNGLMQQEPDRALPIVKNILQSPTQSTRLKERALFVLTQSQSKEAQNILDQIARGKTDPDLQVKAIHMLAAMKGKESAGFLNEIYKNSQNDRVKDAALDGMFISNDATDLVTIARSENDPRMKRRIVSKLALMHSQEATDYMLEILNK